MGGEISGSVPTSDQRLQGLGAKKSQERSGDMKENVGKIRQADDEISDLGVLGDGVGILPKDQVMKLVTQYLQKHLTGDKSISAPAPGSTVDSQNT